MTACFDVRDGTTQHTRLVEFAPRGRSRLFLGCAEHSRSRIAVVQVLAISSTISISRVGPFTSFLRCEFRCLRPLRRQADRLTAEPSRQVQDNNSEEQAGCVSHSRRQDERADTDGSAHQRNDDSSNRCGMHGRLPQAMARSP